MKKNQNKNKNKKKIAALALLGTFAGVSAVTLSAIPWLINKYNLDNAEISMVPNVIRMIKDENNNNKFYAQLLPEWKNREVSVTFVDDQNNEYTTEAKINDKGELIVDTEFLPKGKKYTVKSAKDKENGKELISLEHVFSPNKVIDKRNYHNSDNDLVLQKNFGKENANKKVKITVIDNKNQTKEVEVTTDENGVASVKPKDIFDDISPSSSYGIKSWSNVDGSPLLDENKKEFEEKPELIGGKPSVLYDKDLNDLSKWQLPVETSFEPNSKITIDYEENGEKKSAEIKVNEDGTLNKEDIDKLGKDIKIDPNNIKLNDKPINALDRRQYQFDKYGNSDDMFNIPLGKDKANKEINFDYEATLPNGDKKTITITKISDENGNVALPTKEDLEKNGYRGFEWDLKKIKTKDQKNPNISYDVYDVDQLDKISKQDGTSYTKNKKEHLLLPFLSDKDPLLDTNDKYRVSFTDDQGNVKTVDVNPKTSILDPRLRLLDVQIPSVSNDKSRLLKIEKVNPDDTTEDVTKDFGLTNNHKQDYYVSEAEYNGLSIKHPDPNDPNDKDKKTIDISYPLGKENANKRIDLIAYDSNNNKIVIEGTTDDKGVFQATSSKFRGKNITLDRFVPRGDDSSDQECETCLVNFAQAPDDKKNYNFSVVETPKGKEYIFDVEKQLTPDEIKDDKTKIKALIVNPETGVTREIEVKRDPENKTLLSIPDSDLQPGEKIDKIFNADNNNVIVSNADIPEDKKHEHKLPKITQSLTDDKNKNQLIIEDLPKTIKPNDNVVLEFETDDNPKQTYLKEVTVDADGKIVVDKNELPKDKVLKLKAIKENKTENKSNNNDQNSIKTGHALVDFDNLKEKDPTSANVDVKHVNKIAVKSININNDNAYDKATFEVELDDNKNLINDTKSTKPEVILVDEQGSEYKVPESKISYEITGNDPNKTKKLKILKDDLGLNKTYSIKSIKYPQNAFGEDKNNTLNPDDNSNTIYDKTRDSALDTTNGQYNKKLSVNAITTKDDKSWSPGSNKAQNIEVLIDIDTNLTNDEIKANKFALKYKNTTKDDDVIYNGTEVAEIIEKDGKKQLKFNLNLPHSNRKYEFDKLVIFNADKTLDDLKEKEKANTSVENLKKAGYEVVAQKNKQPGISNDQIKTNEIITKKGKSELKNLSINPIDTDKLKFAFDLESEDAPFDKDQEYEVIVKDSKGNLKKAIVKPASVSDPINGQKQNKKAKFEGVIEALTENENYTFVGVKPATKVNENNPDNQKPHYSDNIAKDPFADSYTDGNNGSGNEPKEKDLFALDNDAKTEKEKPIITLDSTKQVSSIKSVDDSGQDKDAYNLNETPKVKINFSNILEKWKNKILVLEYHSTFNDKMEKVFLSANITDKTQAGDIIFTKTNDSQIKGNRVYELKKAYYLLNNDAADLKNIDQNLINTQSVVINPEDANAKKDSFKTNASAEKNSLKISKVEQQETDSLTKAKLKIFFEDKDEILVNDLMLDAKITLKDHLNQNKNNIQPISAKLVVNKVENENRFDKYLEIETNQLSINQIQNTLDTIEISLVNDKNAKLKNIAFNHWKDTNNENIIIIKKDYKNNNDKFEFGNKLKFKQSNYQLKENVVNNKVQGEVELELLFDNTNAHLNNEALKNKIKFRAEITQDQPSYNHPKAAGSQSNSVKITEVNSFSIIDNKVKIKFSDLVSNRKYNNFRIYVGDTDAITKSTPVENNFKDLGFVIPEFTTKPRETKVASYTKSTTTENGKKYLNISYIVSSLDEVLTDDDAIELILNPIGTNFDYKFAQTKKLLKQQDGTFKVDYKFEIVSNSGADGQPIFKANAQNQVQTFKNDKIEEGVDYAVNLAFVGEITRAANKGIKVNGISKIADNKELINTTSIHDDSSIKQISVEGEPVKFKKIEFTQQTNPNQQPPQYAHNSQVGIKFYFEKQVKRIQNAQIALEFKTKIVDNDGNIIEKTVISSTATIKAENNGGNIETSLLEVSIPANELFANHNYVFSKIKIKDNNDNFFDLPIQNSNAITGSFKVKASSTTKINASNITFDKATSTINKAVVKLELNDEDNVINYASKANLTIELFEESHLNDPSKKITVTSDDINIAYKSDNNKIKILTFNINNPKANVKYKITKLSFANLEVPAFNLDATNNNNDIINDTSSGVEIQNQAIKISTNPEFKSNTEYQLKSELLDLSSNDIKIKIHYKNTTNNNAAHFSNGLNATKKTDSNDGEYAISSDISSFNNGTYEIVAIYLGKSADIDMLDQNKINDQTFINKLTKVDISQITDSHKSFTKN